MKKHLLFAVAAVLTVFVVSCGGSGTGPEKTAQAFLDAVDARNFDKAKELSTAESQKMIEMIAGFAEMAPDTIEVKAKKVSKCDLEGEDKALCTYCCDSEGAETTLNMKKVDGTWKVDMSKETLFGDENPLEDINMDDLQDEMEDMGEEMEDALEEVEDSLSSSME